MVRPPMLSCRPLRFNNIFGTGAGQIPTTATIQSATLQLYITNNSANPMNVHRMAMTWSDTATWTSTGAAPFNATAGIQADGTEARTTADLTLSVRTVNAFAMTANVLTSLQAWQANPSVNFGWGCVCLAAPMASPLSVPRNPWRMPKAYGHLRCPLLQQSACGAERHHHSNT